MRKILFFLVGIFLLCSVAQAAEVGFVGPISRTWIGKTTAPTVSSDVNAGYLVGDKWIDETANKIYICYDDATGAAGWQEVGSGVTNTAANTWTAGQTFTAGVTTPNLVAAESGVSATKLNVYNGLTVYATDGNKALAMDASGNLSILTYLQMYSSNMGTRYAYLQAGANSLDINLEGSGDSFNIYMNSVYDLTIDSSNKTNVYSSFGVGSATRGAFSNGVNTIEFGSGTTPTTFPHPGIIALIVSGVSEMFAFDRAGNFNQISAHDPGTGEPYHNSFNVYTGKGTKFYFMDNRRETYTVDKINPETAHRQEFIKEFKRVKTNSGLTPVQYEIDDAVNKNFKFDWKTMPKFVRQAWGKD